MRHESYLRLAFALLLVLATVAVYSPGLYGPFVFDDLTNILEVQGIRITGLDFDAMRSAWFARETDTFIGRPLAMLSFALNYYFTEFNVFAFKLTNLVIHLLTGAALYGLTIILLRRHRLADPHCSYQLQHLSWLALAITGIWLLHPLNLTSVLYVVQRMTSLSALFTIIGLIGYCLGRQQIIEGRRVGFVTILVALVACGALAVLCKETGVLLLPMAAVVELAFYRFEAHATLVSPFRRFWFVIIVAPLVIGLIVMLAQHDRWFGEHAYHRRDFTLSERLLTQARALWFYLRLIVLPDVSQMGLYHDDLVTSRGLLSPATTLPAVLGILGFVAMALIARRRLPILFFATGWFLVGHSLESSVLPLELVYEHRNYLPQYGVLFGLVYLVAAPCPSAIVRRTLRLRLAFLALFALLVGIGTHSRSIQWKDEFSLYSREVLNHPESARSHTMLGAWMHVHGYLREAREHLTIASNLTLHQAEHLIRLVQNVYLTNRQVPDELLYELRYRLVHSKVSSVTLWVFEPLLIIARDDPTVHDQFIELYTLLVSRPDIDFGKQSIEVAYVRLGENHALRDRTEVALTYFSKGRAINPRPFYDITIADLYAKNGCYEIASRLLSELQASGRPLTARDQKALETVEATLARRGESVRRCSLPPPADQPPK